MSKPAWQPYLPYNAVCCRYGEIGTKGRNRGSFVRRMIEGLGRVLGGSFPSARFDVERGRVYLYSGDGAPELTRDQLEALRREIPALPGVSSVSPGWRCARTMEALEEYLLRTFPIVYEAYSRAFPEGERTYSMRVNRCDKNFPLASVDIEKHFAEVLMSPHPDLKLDLRNGTLRIGVDIRPSGIFVDYERIDGAGGLPAGSAGRTLALLSGGIDSPVACYEMIRRGAYVDFVTFHSSPYTPEAGLTKICDIARVLNHYQHRGRVVAINLLPLQKAIRDNCNEKFRTVLYRRSMMRLASVVGSYFESEALVTGDNLGQVASQTLRNLDIIGRATRMLILRPLLTFDKLEIIARADRIGTRALSAEQVPDSCTVFAPSNPSTRAQLFAVEADEARLDLPALLRQCMEGTVMMNPATFDEYGFPELLGRPIDDLGKP